MYYMSLSQIFIVMKKCTVKMYAPWSDISNYEKMILNLLKKNCSIILNLQHKSENVPKS